MGKRILILNGSPRKNGNTFSLTRALAEEAERAGSTVTEFYLHGMKIGACLGCYGGGKDPDHPCVQRDDMDAIYAVYKAADVVVLASPLYYFTISGQLKTGIDRLFAIMESYPDYQSPAKECALVMAAEGSDYEESVFWYDGMVKHLGWTDRGKVLACGVGRPGDVDDKPALDEARKLGASL